MDPNKHSKQSPQKKTHDDTKDLVQGALVNYLGMFSKVGKVLFLFVAARVYGVPALGLYLLAWGAVDLASKFGLWGLDRSLIRDIARYNTDKSEQTNNKIFGLLRFNLLLATGLSLSAAAVTYLLSTFIAVHFFEDANLVAPLKVLVFALPFIVLTQVLIASTKALRIMRYDVIIRQGFEPLILFICTAAFIPFQLGAIGLATAHVVASIIASIMAVFAVVKTYKHLSWSKEPLSPEVKQDILKYTSPMAAMDFLNLMVARMDIFLVGHFLDASAAGIYGIAIEIISVIKRVRQGFEPIFAPIVSELFYKKEGERLNRTYVLLNRWLLGGTLLPVLAMVLYPTELLSLFGKEATEAAAVLTILALAHGVLGTFSAAENLIVMTGRTLPNTGFAATMLLLNTVISVILIPKLGLAGAALGTLAAFVLISAARLFYCYKELNLHPFNTSLVWPLVSGLLTFILFYSIKTVAPGTTTARLIIDLILLVGVYAGLYFGGAKEPEEKYYLSKVKMWVGKQFAGKSA